jgi:hypothetical protein
MITLLRRVIAKRRIRERLDVLEEAEYTKIISARGGASTANIISSKATV